MRQQSFLDEAQPAITTLKQMTAQLEQDVESLLLYFGLDATTTDSEELFRTIASFGDALQAAAEDVHDERQKGATSNATSSQKVGYLLKLLNYSRVDGKNRQPNGQSQEAILTRLSGTFGPELGCAGKEEKHRRLALYRVFSLMVTCDSNVFSPGRKFVPRSVAFSDRTYTYIGGICDMSRKIILSFKLKLLLGCMEILRSTISTRVPDDLTPAEI